MRTITPVFFVGHQGWIVYESKISVANVIGKPDGVLRHITPLMIKIDPAVKQGHHMYKPNDL